ncbi:MAG: PSD1 and planctomycete cytochrome C domain-containing protein [Gemmataceae bacterium]
MKRIVIVPLSLWVGSLAAAEPVDYVRDVKPILAKHCHACHGPQKQRSGLRVDTAAAIREGGNSGPGLVPGDSQQSKLIHAVTGTQDAAVMPPSGERLTTQQIATLKAWIDQGAKAPADEVAQGITAPKSSHWAFQKPARPKLPAVKHPAWPRNPIDYFILARLEKEGLTPSPEADRITLIRRLSLDLTGLPPTPAEVEAFVNDSRPDAYERLVDRLLASPHYGERWGRHWLDLARYADSSGYTIDGPRSIWKYRDWVIDAFNRDVPFDQFTIEQLAGDLLPNPNIEQQIATGFHRNTLINQEGGIDVEMFRVEAVVDRVNTTGTVYLGLTIACAQCHDHKFDPISQREYYQLFDFLNQDDEPTLSLASAAEQQKAKQIQAEVKELEKVLKTFDNTSLAGLLRWEEKLSSATRKTLPADIQELLEIPENGRSSEQTAILLDFYRQSEQIQHIAAGFAQPLPFAPAAHALGVRLRLNTWQRIAQLKAAEPTIVTTMVLRQRSTPRVTNVLIQGDFTRKGIAVQAGVPSVLHPLPEPYAGNRLTLARWLVDPDNPLTARVTMNRFWQRYFGVGIVETENDFGTQGTLPTHPELLDWLATEFIRQKWSMKTMHRLIVTSATYRQASQHRPELEAIDARNLLLARQNRLRLEAEIVRDVALAASGLLHPAIGGPSVFPPQPDGVYAFTQVNKNWKADTGPNRYRRGMYTYFWRSAPHPGLTVFDAPDANSTCTRRTRSNTPLQALTLLNDQAYLECAQGLAERVLQNPKFTDAERLTQAFRLCLSRPPRSFELSRLHGFLEQQRASFAKAPQDAAALLPSNLPEGTQAADRAAWIMVARVLMNVDEFITRE